MKYLRLSEVPEYVLQLTGMTIIRQTIYNWAYRGRLVDRNNPDSERIRLQTTKFESGSKVIYTSEEWVEDFLREL